LLCAYEGKQPDQTTSQKVAEMVAEIVEELQKTIDVINFWNKKARVRKLEGIIEDILSFSGVEKVTDSCKRIATEILNLARKRNDDLIRNKKDD